MKNEISSTDFNAPHVVFRGADGNLYFAKKSKNYHTGLGMVCEKPNFEQAANYI